MLRKIFIFAIYFISIICYSQENQRKENVLKSLKIKIENFDETVYSEKKITNSANYILCLPIINNQDIGLINYNLIIIICDINGKILKKYIDINSISSDAIALTSTEIDTANYLIKENLKAFGIRLNFRNNSKPNPYSSQNFLLFYEKKDSIKKILDYQINEYRGEWDLNCNGEFEDETGYISFEKTETNGFKNLKIKTKIEKIFLTGNNSKTGDCNEKVLKSFKTQILKYKGGIYQ